MEMHTPTLTVLKGLNEMLHVCTNAQLAPPRKNTTLLFRALSWRFPNPKCGNSYIILVES